MNLVIASDHGGYALKKEVVSFLKTNPDLYQVDDLGCDSENSVDYPDFALQVAQKISDKKADYGILICGTGVGMAITANKIKGVRASSIIDLYTARMAREHNNLNVLCLAGRILTPASAIEIVKTFLNTSFAGGRHQKRLDKITKLEN
ncbi:MAG: ribose 5-phosphate isomerase B [Deltaproteobacteria bacterium RIFCSPLOWO2_12_FULL_40_28]|nr:MAG: ribose 5-phosphate isomerase B [Deltaproteobacteria bacterium RIFCSPHIGHO2_02_FULL_40_28]OGQ19794.1 MAG: ribose 5-phosphate isomerase B [Deltaproteobacteria bacterium RIFCSPHIGHO2_12_FULL_40_32]OGQ41077.1 MAG: ribose 5-phosphate isomerase B [Deltaproteobacteria bacterium RIFCSPLOWO2_02_FULL_40_36]OGQ54194.1 MAG: ribose 5-phosphate isomerase B [Deltaproteobacteria bacterium RIFCSPLOWO2_12_FULL_40_28]